MFPKNRGFPPNHPILNKVFHEMFTIHFGGFPPLFLETPISKRGSHILAKLIDPNPRFLRRKFSNAAQSGEGWFQHIFVNVHHPENRGGMIPILTHIFFRWVGEKPPTSKKKHHENMQIRLLFQWFSTV